MEVFIMPIIVISVLVLIAVIPRLADLHGKKKHRQYMNYLKNYYPDPWSDDPDEVKRYQKFNESGRPKHKSFKEFLNGTN